MRPAFIYTLPAALVIAVIASCARQTKQIEDSSPDKPPLTSKLYERFQPDQLCDKYVGRFSKERSSGVRGGLVITPPDDVFKDFRITGAIAEEDLKKVLASLQADMVELAKASGVTIDHGPSNALGNRPIGLLSPVMFMHDTVDLRSLHGFYFTYRDGPITGAVDVFAVTVITLETEEDPATDPPPAADPPPKKAKAEPAPAPKKQVIRKQWKLACTVHEPRRGE